MKEFLSERNVSYVEYNVEDDPAARERMVNVAGSTTVPTVIVGDEAVVGFDPRKLAGVLGEVFY